MKRARSEDKNTRRWNLLTSNGHVCRPTSFQLSRAAPERPQCRQLNHLHSNVDYIKQQIDRWKSTERTTTAFAPEGAGNLRRYLWTTADNCAVRDIECTTLTTDKNCANILRFNLSAAALSMWSDCGQFCYSKNAFKRAVNRFFCDYYCHHRWMARLQPLSNAVNLRVSINNAKWLRTVWIFELIRTSPSKFES